MNLTPAQKIRWKALNLTLDWKGQPVCQFNGSDEFEEVWCDLHEKYGDDFTQDALYDIRQGECETHLSCEYSRHYESHAVASLMPDGSYVGWTYWYGGGKHGCPEEIDWMSGAYHLNVTEREVVKIERIWSKV